MHIDTFDKGIESNMIQGLASKIFRHHLVPLSFLLVVASGSLSTLIALDRSKTIGQYGHNIWLRQNGLPSNNVALQTSDGYLWFGMSAGLFRFDGVSFVQVSTNPENYETNESVISLCETRDSSLWIGTWYGGLRRLKNGKMYHYGLKEGFYDTQVQHLVESRDRRLLIGTSVGFFIYSNDTFTPVILNPNYISAVAEDSLERTWVGTHDGIRIIDHHQPGKIINITTGNGLPNKATTVIYTDRQKNVWIGTFDGLVRWNNGKFTTYRYENGLSDSHITSIFQDRDGNIWVGTQKGLNRYSGDKWTSYREADGLTDNNVQSFTEDREGSLWVCTSNGLNQFRDVNITTYTTYEGLGHNYISSIVEGSDQSLYFLSSQGANITQQTNGKTTIYNTAVGPVYAARDGSLWIGQSGLLLNIKGGRIKRFDAATGIPQKWISAITEDDRSLILYIDHTGIFRFIHERLVPYEMKNGQHYPAEEYVVCFYHQQKNLLWVGTADWLMKMEFRQNTPPRMDWRATG
jgi:ligand-binding sensor domain-containing protein